MKLSVADVVFVKELYPRLREDDAAIERYRAAIDRLPPIDVARGHVLVDGFHRWQAHKREGLTEIEANDLGNLTDVEILKESIRRNASHGRQLETSDKRRNADLLYRQGTQDVAEIAELLSITEKTAGEYVRDAKRDEKQAQKEAAWDLWLNCKTQQQIAASTGVDQKTVSNWLGEIQRVGNFLEPPESRQHFDAWTFPLCGDDAGTPSYFGKMAPQIVENLLWLYTEPGQIVFDPFVGGGTTIDVAKTMGRRVWASDRKPSTPTLPIHEWDITTGWPKDAPRKIDFTLLDPPYWKQAAGRYSDDPEDLANQSLDDFMSAWAKVLDTVREHTTGFVAFIISPTQEEDGSVVDHAFEMYRTAVDIGFRPHRRIVVTYNTQQATGQQVTWARDNRRLLKLYRDCVVLTP